MARVVRMESHVIRGNVGKLFTTKYHTKEDNSNSVDESSTDTVPQVLHELIDWAKL